MKIALVGPFYEATGYAEINRQTALRLAESGLDVNVVVMPLGATRAELGSETVKRLRAMTIAHGRVPALRGFDAVIYSTLPIFFEPRPSSRCIARTMLETDRLPQAWVDRCNLMDQVWVPSRFNLATFASSGVAPGKLKVVPLGYDPALVRPNGPRLDVGGGSRFKFLSVFEWTPRKGPDLLLAAYLQEFSLSDDVVLVLKAHDNTAYDPSGQTIRSQVEAIARETSGGGGRSHDTSAPIIPVTSTLSPAKMAALYRACDCFVLPTRGEGFGLPLLEAMGSGLPCIATRWSGHLDFVNDAVAYLVDVEGLEPVPRLGTPNDDVYAGSLWARPSVHAIRKLMRHVHAHREEARSKGWAAYQAVVRAYAWDSAVRAMLRQLLASAYARSPVAGLRTGTVGAPGAHGLGAWVEGPMRPFRSRAGQVVMVVPSWGQRCGVAQYTSALVQALRAGGWHVKVLGRDWAAKSPDVAAGSVVHFQYQPALFASEQLRRSAGLLRSRGNPCLATVHDVDPGLVPTFELSRDVFDAVIVHTSQVRDLLVRLGVPRAKIVVIPCGCYDFSFPPVDAVRQELGASSPCVGFFGFTWPHKGIAELALAVRLARARLPGIRLFLFAPEASFETPRRISAEIRRFFDEQGLWDCVSWHSDFRSPFEVAARLHAMDVNVLPYHPLPSSGASSAVRLLLAAKRPIITTDTSYFSDLGPQVVKVSRPDPGELADAIVKVIADEGLARSLVGQVTAYVRANSWQVVARKHARVYEGAMWHAGAQAHDYGHVHHQERGSLLQILGPLNIRLRR